MARQGTCEKLTQEDVCKQERRESVEPSIAGIFSINAKCCYLRGQFETGSRVLFFELRKFELVLAPALWPWLRHPAVTFCRYKMGGQRVLARRFSSVEARPIRIYLWTTPGALR